SRNFTGITIAALSLLVGFSVLRPPPPGPDYRRAEQLIPFLRSIMHDEHIEAGLSEYWYANLITFFSDAAVPIRAVVPSGSLYHWVSNIEWYTGRPPSVPAPRFRLILMQSLIPAEI